jgi:hypothetical protein
MPRRSTRPNNDFEFESPVDGIELDSNEELLALLCSNTMLTSEAWNRTGAARLVVASIEEDRLFQTA